MGRKKATKTLSSYFPHDSNARNDERLVNVRMKHGPRVMAFTLCS